MDTGAFHSFISGGCIKAEGQSDRAEMKPRAPTMGLHYNDAAQYGFRDSLSSAGPLQLACEHQHPTSTPLQLDFLFSLISVIRISILWATCSHQMQDMQKITSKSLAAS